MKRVVWPLVLALVLAACGDAPSPARLRDIGALLPPLTFTLHDGEARTRRAADFAGQVVVLYFGYTHCPDICPTTLARLAGLVRRLGAAAARVSILFVSVDPARDTPAVLHAYAEAFGPRVVALSGSQEQLGALARRYRVSYGLGPADGDGQYEVSHSSAVFIFDPRGRARLLATAEDSDADLLAGIQGLLAAGGNERWDGAR